MNLESDVEEFEDNPEEYIRKDIEKSDSATRRRAACDFLQALCIFFESQVIALYSQYIDVMQKVTNQLKSTVLRISLLGISAKSRTKLVEKRYMYFSRLGSCFQRRNSKSSKNLPLLYKTITSLFLLFSLVLPKAVHSSVFLPSIPPVFFQNSKLLTVKFPHHGSFSSIFNH